MAAEHEIRAIKKAVRSAVNKAAAKASTAASRAVRDIYNIKAGDLKKYVTNRPAQGERYEHIIRVASERRIPLYVFGTKAALREITIRRGRAAWQQKMQFINVKVKKAGGYKPVTKTFIAKMQSGHIGIFERDAQMWRHRKPVKNSRRKSSGLPIAEKLGPGAVTLYEKEGEPALIQTYDRDIYDIFNRELQFYIEREVKK